ncbi:MAG: hypothetical protein ACXACD_20900 [Candidatus Thorarchaeota archaeon]
MADEDQELNDIIKSAQLKQGPEPDKAEARKVGIGEPFDTEKYRQLFNGFLKDPTVLNISSEKSVAEMDNEELTAWIYHLDEFVRDAKVAKQAARVTLEDRRLQMTEEQKKIQYELDKKYKPATPARVSAKAPKAKKGTKEKLTEEQKRIKAAMDLMGLSEEKAIEWLKAKGRL